MQQAGSKRSPGENREDFFAVPNALIAVLNQPCRCKENEMISGQNDPERNTVSFSIRGNTTRIRRP
jgi:hypothetical protein